MHTARRKMLRYVLRLHRQRLDGALMKWMDFVIRYSHAADNIAGERLRRLGSHAPPEKVEFCRQIRQRTRHTLDATNIELGRHGGPLLFGLNGAILTRVILAGVSECS